MESNFRPGEYPGTIIDASLDTLGAEDIPVVRLRWSVHEINENVEQILWLSDLVLLKGPEEGKTQAEVACDTLIKLGYSGKTLSGLTGAGDFPKTAFPLEIDWQRDKAGAADDRYKRVRYVRFARGKIKGEQAVSVFSKFDGHFATNANPKTAAAGTEPDDLPF